MSKELSRGQMTFKGTVERLVAWSGGFKGFFFFFFNKTEIERENYLIKKTTSDPNETEEYIFFICVKNLCFLFSCFPQFFALSHPHFSLQKIWGLFLLPTRDGYMANNNNNNPHLRISAGYPVWPAA